MSGTKLPWANKSSSVYKGYSKDSSQSVSIIEKVQETGRRDSGTMGFVVKPIWKARERYRMHELLTLLIIFSYCFKGRVGDELKLIIHILLLQLNFHFCQENVVELIVEKIVEVFPFFCHNNF